MKIFNIDIPAGPAPVHLNIFTPTNFPEPRYGVSFQAQDLPGVYQHKGRMSAMCPARPTVEYRSHTEINWKQLDWAFKKLDMQNLSRDEFFRGRALRIEVAQVPRTRSVDILHLRKVCVYV